jgi:hypothetical protein
MARIAEAAARVGRSPASVRLVAATKSVPIERVCAGVQAGVRILGENRLQEALTKIDTLGEHGTVSWHFIGHLQRRKVRDVVGLFQMIHSVDSLELAREIDRRAAAAGIRQPILLEVNIGEETTKAGFPPSAVFEAAQALDELMNLDVQGLMAVPPPSEDPERTRRYFQQVRNLAGAIREKGFRRIRMDELSMGMSGDFEVAIEEGATLVRVGTALFGPRPV